MRSFIQDYPAILGFMRGPILGFIIVALNLTGCSIGQGTPSKAGADGSQVFSKFGQSPDITSNSWTSCATLFTTVIGNETKGIYGQDVYTFTKNGLWSVTRTNYASDEACNNPMSEVAAKAMFANVYPLGPVVSGSYKLGTIPDDHGNYSLDIGKYQSTPTYTSFKVQGNSLVIADECNLDDVPNYCEEAFGHSPNLRATSENSPKIMVKLDPLL